MSTMDMGTVRRIFISQIEFSMLVVQQIQMLPDGRHEPVGHWASLS